MKTKICYECKFFKFTNLNWVCLKFNKPEYYQSPPHRHNESSGYRKKDCKDFEEKTKKI